MDIAARETKVVGEMTIVQVVMHCPQPDAQTWFSDWQLAVHNVTIQQDTNYIVSARISWPIASQLPA